MPFWVQLTSAGDDKKEPIYVNLENADAYVLEQIRVPAFSIRVIGRIIPMSSKEADKIAVMKAVSTMMTKSR